VVAVVGVVVGVIAAIGVWLLGGTQPAAQGDNVGLRVGSGVDVASDAYGQPAPAGSAILRLRLQVENRLSATLVVDNGSFVVVAGLATYPGTVDPPGTSAFSSGTTGNVSVGFPAPIGTLVQRVRLSEGAAHADIPYDHEVANPLPQTIGVMRSDTASYWVLTIITVPAPHLLSTTTFLMRWPTNSSIVTPPGQATLQTLKTVSGGVGYFPVSGAARTDLRINDVITISKAYTYTTGMYITIADGTTMLWAGTL